MRSRLISRRFFVFMGLITLPKTWIDNENVLYTDINADFQNIYNEFNGNIDNSNIKPGAAIDPTKISGTAMTLNAAQIVAGQKTFIKPILNAIQVLTTDIDTALINFDMSASNVHTVTLGGNRTLQVSNVSIGQFFQIDLIQDATGGRTVTWFGGIKWVNSQTPILTSTPGKIDSFVFKCIGTNSYIGYIAGTSIG